MFADVLTNTADPDRTALVERSGQGLQCKSSYQTDSFMFRLSLKSTNVNHKSAFIHFT